MHGSSETGAGAPSPTAEEAHDRRVHPWLDGVRPRPGAVRHPAFCGKGGFPATWELPKTQARWVCFWRWSIRSSLYERASCELRLSWTVSLLWNIFLKRSKMYIACAWALTFTVVVWGRSGRMGPFFWWKGWRWDAFSSYLTISACRFSRQR